MIFGYCRSRKKEELKEQRLQLTEVGCVRIFVDDCSTKMIRGNFDKMVEQVRKGDQIVVPSVYVFPLTMIELVEFLNDMHLQEVRFKSLREKMVDLSVFPYLQTYQKRSRSERAMANLNDGRKSNKNAGRPTGLSDEAKKEVHAVAQLYQLKYTIDQIMDELNMTSRSQVYKRLREAKINPERRKKLKSE
jgi:DNA invertase Pin-like site-specific DNA recombinase